VIRRVAVIASCTAALALGALPASAAVSHTHRFGIPGVYGIRAWGSYTDAGSKVQVTVCVEDTARNVYGAAAVGLAFGPGYRHHSNVGAAAVGFGHSQCRTTKTPYKSHLVVEALSGDENGEVRQRGHLKRIY
jgi:hypothetical protein